MIKVLVVDDHQLFAEGLANLLTDVATISVVGVCTDASLIMEFLDRCMPDIVLLDINLGETDGFTVCRKVLYRHPLLKVIAVTMYHELRYVRGMKEAGALGYLRKNASRDQVYEAVQIVYSGGTYLNEPLGRELNRVLAVEVDGPSVISALNPKEKRILDGVLLGKTSRQIGEDLGVSLKTVEFYRSSLFVKFDVKNVVELVNKARSYGLD